MCHNNSTFCEDETSAIVPADASLVATLDVVGAVVELCDRLVT